MAYEQNLRGQTAGFESGAEISLKQRWKSTSAASENLNGCFDCNICLDSAHDPVVTLCGHLYCWPCIYKWLHVQTSSSSFESDNETTPKCPVCKANISQSSLVPLYGRGTSPSESDARKPQTDVIVPRRPKSLGMHHPNSSRSQPQPRQFHQQQHFPNPYGSYASMASSNFGGTAMMVGMFGEMVFARMFGGSDTSLFAYPNSNTYPLMGSGGSPRLRRQEMELEKSLNRVSIFLFCCFVLCLLLF